MTPAPVPRRPGRRAALAAAALLCACAAVDRADPPAWLDAPPSDATYLYGVGNYVGALYPEDNLKYALDSARGTLSRNLESRIVSDTHVRETESSSSLNSRVSVSTDYVLRNAEHIDTWIDVGGVRGRRGTVWVLMRVPRQ